MLAVDPILEQRSPRDRFFCRDQRPGGNAKTRPSAIMPNRIPAFGILTRLAAASATAALVEGAALLFGWYSFVTSLSRRIVFFDPFDPDPAPPTFQDFLFADETRRFHFVTTNIAALVFAVMLISSFKVDFRETKSRARFALLKLSTIAFSMVAIIAASNWISFRN